MIYGRLFTFSLDIRRKFKVKLPTIWTDEKQRWEESEKRREEEIRSGKRSQKTEDAGERKVAKSRNTVFFQWSVAPEGRKVGSLKQRVRSHLARWEMKNCTPLWREAHFQVKMLIKGPDDPTRQLLPIRKDKGGGGGPRSKTKLCVTKLYVKDGVWQRQMVCVCVTKLCVTKLCVKDGVSKMVGDKVVCERWCVAKWCVKDGVAEDGVRQSCVWKMVWWKKVCDKVVYERWCGERWCVTKWCVKNGVWQSGVGQKWGVKDGVWQSGVKDGVSRMLCERWRVTKWCVTKLCVKDSVWQSCVWKIVCDKVERWCVTKCERWCVCVTKMVCERGCVKDGVWQSRVWKMEGDKIVCERWCDKDGGWQCGVWKMVCQRRCVTKLGVKEGVWKMLCDEDGVWKRVYQRWCVTECVKDGVWQRWRVTPQPAQCHKGHACHAKRRWMSPSAMPATWNQGGCHQVPRLPRKVPRRHARPSGPERATQCHECHACHAKRRWMWDCATPATWNARRCH